MTQNTNVILTSTDLITWSQVTLLDSSQRYFRVAYGDGRFLAVSRSSPYAYSEDGITWNTEVQNNSFNVSGFGFDAEFGFYISGTETILRQLVDSTDFATWNSLNFPANTVLTGIQKLNGALVAVGGDGLILSTAANAEGYNGWVLDNFPGTSDPLIIGEDRDPDQDGIANLQEYARGTDPNAASARLPKEFTRSGFGPQLTWQHPEPPTDVAIDAEYSTDLLTWRDDGLLVTSTSSNGTISFTARVTGNAGTSPKLFMRIRWDRVR